MGVLRSAKDLEIRSLYQEEPLFSISYDDKRSDSILGFEWIFKNELMVVSKDGVQFYTMDANKTKVQKRNQIKIRMNWYQYWNDAKLLVISTGSSNLFIYKIAPKSAYEIYPTLQLNLPQTRTLRGIEPLPVQITRMNIFLLTIYSHNYVGFLNNWIGTPTLSLYRVTSKTCYRKEYELGLQAPGSFTVNTIDNLLVVHNMTERHTLIFDIKALIPTEALLKPSGELFDFLVTNQKEKQIDVFEEIPEWSSAHPNYILSPISGRVYAMQLNLSQCLEFLGQRPDFSLFALTEFIIRRKSTNAYNLRNRPITKAISTQADMSVLRPIFDVLYANFDTSRTITDMKRNYSLESVMSEISSRFSSVASAKELQFAKEEGTIASFQEDLFLNVFTTDITIYMAFVLLEFIESQRDFEVPVQDFIYDFLVYVLMESKSYTHLKQLIQFGLIPDSLNLASVLSQSCETDSILFKMSIEMFMRMECHHDVLHLLTSTGRLLDAIQYANQTNTLKILKPIPFLDSALQTGDKTLFLNVYKHFEEHGLIPLTNQMNHDFILTNRDGINKFISVYRELWGPHIDMENI